jgi:3'-phosphoadenosine 5'-phosphosulfate sulfotransferase (PAPS reductase)/FAD synthetase
MDVFIPEEYVMRRRKEKMGAAIAGKRQEESRKRSVEEKKTNPSSFRLENESLVAHGLSESVNFSWFSA